MGETDHNLPFFAGSEIPYKSVFSEEPAFFQAGMPVSCNNDMVEYPYTEDLSRFSERSGDGDVRLRGFRVAGGMVVYKDH